MKIGIYQRYWGQVGGGQRYIGFAAETLARNHQVEIIHHQPDFDVETIAEALDLNLDAITFRFVPLIEHPTWETRNPRARLRLERAFRADLSDSYDVFIDNSDIPPFYCHAKRGVLVVHFPLVTVEEYHGYTTEEWKQRPWPLKLLSRAFHRLEWRERFSGYQLIVSNSEYSQLWLKRIWNLDSQIVYPPLRTGFTSRPKDKLIVSIGAFRGARHKRQDAMIEAFRRLCDSGLVDWRLSLVGACGPSPEDQAYLLELRDLAEGYPIDILADVSGAEIKSLLERSSALWHAMGYGIDELKSPKLLEHFGMVAVEAMAAGSVPIVFRGGGLPEIVEHHVNGLLWSSLDDLCDQTYRFCQDESWRRTLSEQAQQRADRFSAEAFSTRLLEVLSPVLS
jgi:glycosyltransferase involved in cell wall biosynthesis